MIQLLCCAWLFVTKVNKRIIFVGEGNHMVLQGWNFPSSAGSLVKTSSSHLLCPASDSEVGSGPKYSWGCSARITVGSSMQGFCQYLHFPTEKQERPELFCCLKQLCLGVAEMQGILLTSTTASLNTRKLKYITSWLRHSPPHLFSLDVHGYVELISENFLTKHGTRPTCFVHS